MSGPGHNSNDSAAKLVGYVRRIEAVQAEVDERKQDIGEIKKEAKSAGFDMKALNRVLQRRRMDDGDRTMLDELVELYEGFLE